MTPPDSVIVLGQMLSDGESDSAVVFATQQKFLTEKEVALRETGKRENSMYAARGRLFLEVKERLGHGHFLKWIAERQDRFDETEGHEGFFWSDSTIENYMNTCLWQEKYPDSYQQCSKRFGAGMMFRLAPSILAGKDLEDVLDTYRRKKLLTAGNNDQQDSTIPIPDTVSENDMQPDETSIIVSPIVTPETAAEIAQYPSLRSAIETGKLHIKEAARIVEAVERSVEPRVFSMVRDYGVHSADVVEALENIAHSMDTAKSKDIDVTDVFSDIARTGGYVELHDGTQVHLSEATSREVWGGYREQRKEGGAGAHASKSVLRDETHREAIEIVIEALYPDPADKPKRDHLLRVVRSDPDNQQYSLSITRVVIKAPATD